MTNQTNLLSALVNRAELEIEGQTISFPDLDIAKNDDLLRRALAPFYPSAANAKFERQEAGEVLKVKVIKRMGSKG